MAVNLIPELPLKSTLAGTDLFVIDDGEHTYKMPFSVLNTLIASITAFGADPEKEGHYKISLAGEKSFSAYVPDPKKQDKLDFDSVPTQGSTNPVTSGGIKAALDEKLNTDDYKLFTGATSEAAGEKGLVPAPGAPNYYLGSGGSWEQPDGTPISDSAKLITSAAVYAALAGKLALYNNAGFHNSIYRGKDLGTSVTAAQWAAIKAGTFDDMFIGDYWTINGRVYRIAAFDYWLHCGDTECTTHHVVIVPDANIGNAAMNGSNVTTGAYYGSAMRGGDTYPTGGNLKEAYNTIVSAFGSAHILSHREYLTNAMHANGYPSGGVWKDSTVDLMNERMVYGNTAFTPAVYAGVIPANYTIDKSQLPLFALDPSRITNRATWWLRDPVSASYFALVLSYGSCTYSGAGNSYGVRPAFAIMQS